VKLDLKDFLDLQENGVILDHKVQLVPQDLRVPEDLQDQEVLKDK
jgi:hypothetical protein